MPRTRRIAPLIALALVAGLGVTGCSGGQPDTAAVVAGVRITNKQVEELTREALQIRALHDPIDGQAEVLGLLVITELGRRLAAERKIQLAAPDAEQAAQQLGLPPDSKLVRANAEWIPVGVALSANTEPAPLQDEDIGVLVAAWRRSGTFAATASTNDIVKVLRSDQDLPGAVGLRNLLRAAGDRYGLTVNPRYGRLIVFKRLPLLRGAVVDLPAA
jgi:hypothetical protein